MSAFGGKADMTFLRCECLLMTQSGHGAAVGTYVKVAHRHEPPGGDMRRGGARRPVKGQRATKPGGRKVSTALVSGAEPREQIARLMRDRDEALEQLAQPPTYSK
jgi:hypothetical protein